MATIYKWSGTGTTYATNVTSFASFLEEHKSDTFLNDCTFSLSDATEGKTLTISKDNGTVIFSLWYSQGQTSTSGGRIAFSNGAISHAIQQQNSNSMTRCWLTSAILGNTSLIVSCSYNSSNSYSTTNNMMGVFMLTKDSNGKLSAVFRNCTVVSTTVTQSTNLVVIAGDSTGKTTINVTPAYNLQKTGLAPIVVNTSSNTTTIPTFYTSFQTEIPSLGFYHGRMNGVDYISNGYCFLRLQN